jgi:hypothetical protein
VLFSAVKHGYFLGFYFWLDVIATLSLLFDIPAFVSLLTPVGAGQTSGQGGTMARAGRSANAGSKMGRILRLVRVIQLLRRIYKYEQRLRDARRASALGSADADMMLRKLDHPRNARVTRVGAKLSDLTTRCACFACGAAVQGSRAPAAPCVQPRHPRRAVHPVHYAHLRCALLSCRRREQL